MRLDYKRRIRRAVGLGYKSVLDRFINDNLFRTQMTELGWSREDIGDVDEIGSRPPMENTGRSAYERWKWEGWYDRHEEDPQGKPDRNLDLAPTHIISNLRRRQETQYWKGKAKGESSHRETDASDGKAKGKTAGDGKAKGKTKDMRSCPTKGSSGPEGYPAFYHEKGRHQNGKPWSDSKGKSSSQKGEKGKSSQKGEKGKKGKGK